VPSSLLLAHALYIERGKATTKRKFSNSILIKWSGIRQDKTRRDETTQDKTRQDKTGQDTKTAHRTRQDKTTKHKTRQDGTRQDKMGQGKMRQVEARHNMTQHDEARHNMIRHDTNTTRRDKIRRDVGAIKQIKMRLVGSYLQIHP
jgi:hypothetical protein